MKSFLMLGQSNMAGRGDFGEVPEIKNPLCKMLRNGRWQPMSKKTKFTLIPHHIVSLANVISENI